MFEPAIGLEVHLALRTASKLFCGCSAEGFGLEPNVNTCPVCLGLPGSLPVVNGKAVELATTFALALGCKVAPQSKFHRKHYFYPDAPKNYQISQFDEPIGTNGSLSLPSGRSIGITRCHLEEDAGRLVHPAYADHSLVDLNRAGAPLIEMVTEPDLRSAEEARDFLFEVRAIARALAVSDASPEEGKMRADVNVSLALPGAALGTKVEVKNLNSFRNVATAIEFELRRQRLLLEAGRRVSRETRGFNEGGQRTYSLRGKEDSADYRYLADPDLPELPIQATRLAQLQRAMPELPQARAQRYIGVLGLRPADAHQLAYDREAAALFDATAGLYPGPPQVVANWLVGEVAALVKEAGGSLSGLALRPASLARLLMLLDEGAISGASAKELLPEVAQGADPDMLVGQRGLTQLTDHGALAVLVAQAFTADPELVARARANPRAVNALLGAVMRLSGGTAQPELVRKLVEQRLEAGG